MFWEITHPVGSRNSEGSLNEAGLDAGSKAGEETIASVQ
jgi:hypothetical protein